jgi:hypothetical protein
MEEYEVSKEEIAHLLRRIGWHPSDLKQLQVYARMEPSQKVEQMLRVRDDWVRLLEERLTNEHPDRTQKEIKRMVIEHLALLD